MSTDLRASPHFQTLKTSFKVFSAVALVGWLPIFFLPFWEAGPTFVVSVSVTLLAVIYGFLLKLSFSEKGPTGGDKPGFFNLRGVIALFQKPTAILAAWVHILAFDLMAAVYIQQEGTQLGMSHWILLPCYFLTLMFGPLGLLLFVILRFFVA